MTQTTQHVANILNIGSHMHLIHYSVTFLALASIFGAVYYVAKKRNRRMRYKVKLVQKKYITHDTVVLTFLLPPTRKTLGLKIGEHVEIEAIVDGKIINRKYTPISRIDRKQTFELLVKIYNKNQQWPEGGVMSQYLDLLQINDEIDITLPYGRFNYQKLGQVKISTLDKKTLRHKYKNFYMVAGGTGITPLYQIIQYISENQKQAPINLTLLFANRTEDDILLLNQLKAYEKENSNLKVFFSVDKAITPEWNGMVGYVNDQKVEKSMGDFVNNLQETIFLSCGPPILSNIVQKIWRSKYNIKPEQMFRF